MLCKPVKIVNIKKHNVFVGVCLSLVGNLSPSFGKLIKKITITSECVCGLLFYTMYFCVLGEVVLVFPETWHIYLTSQLGFDSDSLESQPWASLVAQSVKNPPAMKQTGVQFLGRVDPLEKEMATHSSILAWRIPWTEEPGRLQSRGLQELGTT